MNRQQRIARMRDSLRKGLAAVGQERIQRNVVHSIILDAYAIGEPVLEWLAAELGASPQPEPNFPKGGTETELRCPGCGKNFATIASLNGHGPARCLDKQQRK